MIPNLKSNIKLEKDFEKAIYQSQMINSAPEQVVDVPQKALIDLLKIKSFNEFWKGLSPLNSPNFSQERSKDELSSKEI